MADIEELRKRRLQQLMQQQTQERLQQEIQAAEVEKQIKLIIRKILTPDARERLGNIRAANPDYARQVEILLIQLLQAGKLPENIDDEQFKELLIRVKGQKRETRISKL